MTTTWPPFMAPNIPPTIGSNLEWFFPNFLLYIHIYIFYIYLPFCSYRKWTDLWNHPPHNIPIFAFFAQHYDLELFQCLYTENCLFCFFQCCVIFPGMVYLPIPLCWALRLWSVSAITNNAVKTLPVHIRWAHMQVFPLGFWLENGTIFAKTSRILWLAFCFIFPSLLLFKNHVIKI